MTSLGKSKIESPVRKTPSTPPKSSLINNDLMDASLTSSTSTIVNDDSLSISITSSSGGAAAATAAVVKPLNMETQSLGECSPIRRAKDDVPKLQQASSMQHININYVQHSGSSNGSSPDFEEDQIQQQQQLLNGAKIDDKANKNLGNIQTYR